MAQQLFTNNANGTMSGTLAQAGTTMTLSAGQGARFPAPTAGDYFLGTICTKDVGGNETNIEVVKVTARTADTLTLVRDFENITGQVGGYAYDGNATTVYFALRWTAYAAGNTLNKDGNLASLASAATARTNLGLGNVDNTSDANKPISTAQQSALNGKASLAGSSSQNFATANLTATGDVTAIGTNYQQHHFNYGAGYGAILDFTDTSLVNNATIYVWGSTSGADVNSIDFRTLGVRRALLNASGLAIIGAISSSVAGSSIAVESPLAPTLLNSWVNYGGGYQTAGYWKDAFGVVHLQGRIKSGTVGTNAWVLPAGYCPTAAFGVACLSNGALGSVTIDSTGAVQITAGNNAYIDLSGITFRTT